MIKLKSLLKENNQEKASLRLILHLDKKFPTKQKGHFPLSMRNKIISKLLLNKKNYFLRIRIFFVKLNVQNVGNINSLHWRNF